MILRPPSTVSSRGSNGLVAVSGDSQTSNSIVSSALTNLQNGTGSPFPVTLPTNPNPTNIPNYTDRYNVNLPVASPAGSWALGILGNNFVVDLELDAAQAETEANIIASPRVITANQVPDHATIARFRTRHELALGELFGQVLGLCARAGLVSLGVVAVDSSVQAGRTAEAGRPSHRVSVAATAPVAIGVHVETGQATVATFALGGTIVAQESFVWAKSWAAAQLIDRLA